jgi:hypothetical protein
MSCLRSLPVVVGASVALLVGCGGGGDDESADGPSSTTRSEPTSTTAAPATIDLSQPIPGGSLHGTPRPPLENTGDDYVAIVESLIANFRWLTENPDPEIVPELYVPGTGDHDGHVGTFTELVANGWRAADDGYYVVSVEVVDATPAAVSLRVTDTMEFERIVDETGQQVGEGRPRSPTTRTWNVLLTPDTDRWRIADWAEADGGTVLL